MPSAHRPALERLVELVGGHALSIELLAARTVAEGGDVADTLARYEHQGARYVAADADAMSKDFSLSVSLQLSFSSSRVSETARELLCVLAIAGHPVPKSAIGRLGPSDRDWDQAVQSLLAVGLIYLAPDRFPTCHNHDPELCVCAPCDID